KVRRTFLLFFLSNFVAQKKQMLVSSPFFLDCTKKHGIPDGIPLSFSLDGTFFSRTKGPPDLSPVFSQQLRCTEKTDARFKSLLP
ncbi:MAG: hypothetical protein PUG26_05945, partial [Oscillospiraceae bacterium]|nr:hypothetical protein [Oscillospiraceae bacterium]